MAKTCVLVVDDEPIGREMMAENLTYEGYLVVEADSGEAAWDLIDAEPARFHVILLDRLMPDMDGIDVLRRMKARPETMHLPVIMQTGMTADSEVLEGLKAGAYYYLTKPFAADTLLAIVAAAARDYYSRQALAEEVKRQGNVLSCLAEARFIFRTPQEARDLATLLANTAPDPGRIVLGLSELMLNAIEHGNLDIGYDRKTALIENGSLEDEIERLLNSSCLHTARHAAPRSHLPAGVRWLPVWPPFYCTPVPVPRSHHCGSS